MVFRKDPPLKDSLPSRWTCPLCLLLMNQPIQTARGQLACKSCFIEAKGSSNLCPIDHKPIAPSEIFSDIYAQRTISQLQTWCTYIHNDCNWEGTVGQLTNHATYRPTHVCTARGLKNTASDTKKLRDVPDFFVPATGQHLAGTGQPRDIPGPGQNGTCLRM